MYAMRTTLDLDDALMAALLARQPGATKREAVETAIREYLRSDALERLRALRGKIKIEDVSADLRRDRLA
jgi:Arc/MetJ family transcription regulator